MSKWTDERITSLKKMWNEGQSASEIARELGGVTRNAVIGKIHRLGLRGRSLSSQAKPKPAPAAKPAEEAAKPKPKPRPQVKAKSHESKGPAKPVVLLNDTPWDTEARSHLANFCGPETTRQQAFEEMRRAFPDRDFIMIGLVNVARGMGIKFMDTGSPKNADDEACTARVLELEKEAYTRVVSEGHKKYGIMDLTQKTCKWPIGDPASDDFWFCGLPSVKGKSYCEHHNEVAYSLMSTRWRQAQRSG